MVFLAVLFFAVAFFPATADLTVFFADFAAALTFFTAFLAPAFTLVAARFIAVAPLPFFASCPANCRKQTSRVAELEKEFGPEEVKFLSITVDPESDTPKTLAGYARSFPIHALAGDVRAMAL